VYVSQNNRSRFPAECRNGLQGSFTAFCWFICFGIRNYIRFRSTTVYVGESTDSEMTEYYSRLAARWAWLTYSDDRLSVTVIMSKAVIVTGDLTVSRIVLFHSQPLRLLLFIIGVTGLTRRRSMSRQEFLTTGSTVAAGFICPNDNKQQPVKIGR